MVFLGNTQMSVAYMLKHSHFYEPLPDKCIDSAFLDRIHAFNPGWEVQPVRLELFCSGYGIVVDYVAEALKHLRTEDYIGLYMPHFETSSEVSTRDQSGFEKTFSGLMKIIHPAGKATPQEIAELLAFAMECPRRVREQILRIDDTFKANDFAYRPLTGGDAVTVLTPEEQQYPAFAGLRPLSSEAQPAAQPIAVEGPGAPPSPQRDKPQRSQARPRSLQLLSRRNSIWSYPKTPRAGANAACLPTISRVAAASSSATPTSGLSIRSATWWSFCAW